MNIIAIILSAIVSITTTYGMYHIQKLDGVIQNIQKDKIEMIDKINDMDKDRKKELESVKNTLNDINVTLASFVARTEANRFTASEGLAVWREISTLKQQIIGLQSEIKRNHEEIINLRK